MMLTNPTPYATRFQTMTAPLAHWADEAPDRVWLAERSGDGWRTLTYREAHEQVEAIAGALAAMGVVRLEPLLILANNGIDHALIGSCTAMSQAKMPIAPVSPQYGLRGANPARLAMACRVLKPACVYTDDAALFAEGLLQPGLSGLPVVTSKNPGPRRCSSKRCCRAAARSPMRAPRTRRNIC